MCRTKPKFRTEWRVLLVVVVVLATAACGTDAAPENSEPATAVSEEPWTLVSVPSNTGAFFVTSDAGDSFEVQSICLTIQVSGVLDEDSAQQILGNTLTVLGLDQGPGSACSAEIVVSGSAQRRCAGYTIIDAGQPGPPQQETCCGGAEAHGEVTLLIDGQVRGSEKFDAEWEPPDQPLACDQETLHLQWSSVGTDGFPDNPLVEAQEKWIQLTCPLDAEVFWRLVAGLHNEDPTIAIGAAGHLAPCAEEWEAQGRPDTAVPWIEAVPHLIRAIDRIGDGRGHQWNTLRTITGVPFEPGSGVLTEAWEWWEAQGR